MPSATPPAGWLATLAPGASSVAVVAYSPTALSAGDVAIVSVLLFGFAALIVLNLLLVMRRSV